MRIPNPELAAKIKRECLALLMKKEPEEIGMRDIAKACDVTATSIYYYHRDKDSLFEEIKLDCLAEMENAITGRLAEDGNSVEELREGLRAFRDWALENPRKTLLILGRFKPNLDAPPEQMKQYYRLSDLIAVLLSRAKAEGLITCTNAKLQSALIVAGISGAVEAVIQKRTDPEYWDAEVLFTDSMIDMLCPAPTGKGKRK